MPVTPDRFPGVRQDEGIDLANNALAAVEGEMRYIAAGRFSFYDNIGEYDPRSGLPGATGLGQTLISTDGSTLTVQTFAVSDLGEIAVDDEGVVGVVG